MKTVRNLTNSPYDIQTIDGFERLPAFGEVTAEFSDTYLDLLEASLAVEVSEADETADEELTELRKEYTEIAGKKFYHGWTADELREKIAAAREEG